MPCLLTANVQQIFWTLFFYSTMFSNFLQNKLISENQFGFKHGDSCVKQALVIT